MTSFQVAPHEALFTGLFLEEAAAQRYLSLNAGTSPYRYGTVSVRMLRH